MILTASPGRYGKTPIANPCVKESDICCAIQIVPKVYVRAVPRTNPIADGIRRPS